MTAKTFFNFVRLKTLPVGLMPILVGLLFAKYYFNQFNILRSFLLIIGLISINFFVSAWNNLMDYKKAVDIEYREKQNILSTHKIPEKLAWKICFVLLAIDIVIGIILTFMTNLMLLPIGGICFIVAIFYTYGPFAFSRFPLGEILACLAEGLGSFFIAVYINSYQFNYFNVSFEGFKFNIVGDLKIILSLVLVGLFCGLMNFNVMLADNISDLNQDIKNERYTLPSYLGIPRSLNLFKLVYLVAFFLAIFAVILKILPVTTLLLVIALPLIYQNTNHFLKKQSKQETFKYSIQNLQLFEGAVILALAVELVIHL
ncbi:MULTISPECIES: UbiA family prenyltransferase [unclassified Enterococcus]|uniref:UbiA family prenyltransferase n=1 Tax=unclassified Enterococcus TaxID=2608891 RepID=UPI0015582C25|nr:MULTISPECIES: UbiA family prenyltransferase [unclassified Enterococcus]MBS7576777.1 UbiA family prenyltransferase [Enterococcus sp. MMGLQ5-2]MBS7583736.1 UbiA family prenyltransferase [Enterococcus sp. MMGLQ5-1]NPD11597.1 UbiA family prenyltransferase [Enterococcus sp. MMGLQ5-1]NPD36614.1 UbiA family prenyltransferase [Enterococcus sp. MMGLQ5-2]